LRADGDDPPIVAFVENNNHDQAISLMNTEQTKIYWKYGYNNRVHGNDTINLFVNFREL
jgi:hypothetical protein